MSISLRRWPSGSTAWSREFVSCNSREIPGFRETPATLGRIPSEMAPAPEVPPRSSNPNGGESRQKGNAMEHGHDDRTQWALWRFSILGPLVSARLEHGDRRALFEEISGRTHVAPDGSVKRFSRRTIEAWYYVWKKGGFEGLKDCPRSDLGKSSIRPELREKLVVLKRENPRRSIPRLIKILERTGDAHKGELSKSSVQRYLRLEGLSGRAGEAEPPERRSFRHPEPGDLW